MTNMTPIPIPDQAVLSNPKLKVLHIGPPRGMTDEECGTVESLYGTEDGLPVYADYWRPTPQQLDDLANGGYIELRQYVPQMIMHAMTVHAVDRPEDPEIIVANIHELSGWLDSYLDGLGHVHERSIDELRSYVATRSEQAKA